MKRLGLIPGLLFVLSACGGGGGSTTPNVHAAESGPTQSGSLSIAIPLQSGTAATRRSQFVSPNAAQAVVAVNGTQAGSAFDVGATSSSCTTSAGTRTCTLTVSAPVGNNQDIAVELLASGTSPAILGEGSNSVNVVAGTPWTVAVGINPMAAGVASFSFSGGSFTYGTPATLTGTITFKDPSGAPITGSGNVPNFLIPVTLHSSDGHITFSTPGLNTPGQTFTATYDGSQAVASSVTLSLAAGTVSLGSQTVTLPGLIATRVNTGPVGSGQTTWPMEIVVGPDNNIWWAEFSSHKLQKLTPGGSTASPFATGLPSGPIGIAAGGDGNIWYSGGTTINRITPGFLAPPTGPASIAIGASVGQLTTDSQGNVWFVEPTAGKIGYIDGTFTPNVFNVPTPGVLSSNTHLALGPDNAIYFNEVGTSAWKIGRVNTPATGSAGTFSETPIPGAAIDLAPLDITAGPDGHMWFAEFGSGANADNQFVGTFPPGPGTVAITEFPNFVDPAAFGNLVNISKGSDGNLWIVEGGGAVKFPPSNPTASTVELFTDNGGSSGQQCVSGPDGNQYCTEIGSAALAPFAATADGVVYFKPR